MCVGFFIVVLIDLKQLYKVEVLNSFMGASMTYRLAFGIIISFIIF